TPAPATTDPATRSTTPRPVNLRVDKITGSSPPVLARGDTPLAGGSPRTPNGPEPPATGEPAAGTDPATSPGLPPCGTPATRRRALIGRPGPHHAAGLAGIPPSPVGGVTRHHLRLDKHLRRTDNGGEIGDQIPHRSSLAHGV